VPPHFLRGVLAALVVASSPSVVRLPAQTTRLSRPPEFWNPDWSPNGKSIVFESTMDGKYAIYAIEAIGSGLKRLTPDTSNNEQPRWSRDGKQISYSSDRDSGHLDIFVMNADGSAQTRLTTTPSGGFYQSSFSPDGKWVLFQGRLNNAEVRDHAYVVGADGTGMRQLTDSSYAAEGPEWSADGKSITFKQVRYPKRLWSEMTRPEMEAANKGARMMTMKLDGSALVPAVPATASTMNVDGVSGMRRSPDGSRVVYQKTVDGWAGIYVANARGSGERLLVGGPGAGPLGYLRTVTLTASADTIDSYESPRTGGSIARGNGAYVVRSVRQISERRWELSDTWYDSLNRETAKQSSRTARGSLVTEVEWVRATGDSATLVATPDRVSGWVVPAGKAPQLFDGASTGDRYAGLFVLSAVAKAKAMNGALFVAPSGSLYGGSPIATRVDSIRVVRRDTLYAGGGAIPVVVLRRGTGEAWMEEETGNEVLTRGNAGPEKYWWHIRRGVLPPQLR